MASTIKFISREKKWECVRAGGKYIWQQSVFLVMKEEAAEELKH